MTYSDVVTLLRDLAGKSHKEIWDDIKHRLDIPTFNLYRSIYQPDEAWQRARRYLLDEAHDRGVAKARARMEEVEVD